MTAGTTHALLTRHFLRRFLENDLISPEADRSQFLAVAGAGLFSTIGFISIAVSMVYVIGEFTAGEIAMRALDDRTFYIAFSMIVVALLAASQWDALVIDARDAAIFEPLPVRTFVVRRAKLAAVAIFGAGATVLLNLVPSFVFPILVMSELPLTPLGIPTLIGTHLLVTVAATVFGFVSIVALRETAAALLGGRWFARVSPWLQGALIVVLGSLLLMLPAFTSRVESRALRTSTALAPHAWFLGAYETLAGHVVIDSRPEPMTPRQARRDARLTAAYHTHRAQFRELAGTAVTALAGVLALAAAAYAWNARRYPALAPPVVAAARRRWPMANRLARQLLVHAPATRAGFFFTTAALWRSGGHRLTIAGAAAAGAAMAVLALAGVNLDAVREGGRAVTRLLVAQPFLYGALLAGFRHAIRVPAELRANWAFELAWRGEQRQFLTGARRAALLWVVMPALLTLMPITWFALGAGQALLQAALGFAGATVLLEVLLVSYEKVPFTCAYVPRENIKALAPLYAVMFFVGAFSFARMQGEALNAGGFPTGILVTLAIWFAAARAISLVRHRTPSIDFNEVPVTTQRLGLHT